MIDLKDLFKNEKPEYEVIEEDLKKCMEFQGLKVKDNLSLNMLHKIWHHGVIGNVKIGKYIFVLEARGERHIKLFNFYVGNNEVELRLTNSNNVFNSILKATLISDKYIFEIKDRQYFDSNEDICIIKENSFYLKVYDSDANIVINIKLKAELCTEAVMEIIEYFHKNYSSLKEL